jgi:hypothetical protein
MTLTYAQVATWLAGYVWGEDSPQDAANVIACIMAQDDWKYIDAVADKYAGAQAEPGPAAFSEGTGFALSALYECHDGPHQPSCPNRKEQCPICPPGQCPALAGGQCVGAP